MIANEKDIFVSVFRELSDDQLYSFIRLLNLSSSVLCELPVETTKEIIDGLLDAEELYEDDLLTDEEISLLTPTIKHSGALIALARKNY